MRGNANYDSMKLYSTNLCAPRVVLQTERLFIVRSIACDWKLTKNSGEKEWLIPVILSVRASLAFTALLA